MHRLPPHKLFMFVISPVARTSGPSRLDVRAARNKKNLYHKNFLPKVLRLYSLPKNPKQPSMAKVMSPRILTSSTSLLFPSAHSKKSLFPPQSVEVIAKPISRARSSGNPSGLLLADKAFPSAAASAVVPDDIADVLGEVSIFTAAGEPVKFKDLWDQKEVIF
ncbi:hypothetical protein Salat_1412500 [Sesamum alatum]|uniref:Uncharacterized protein n=1 Tax=Sesamum alatum TaxID=300844 RepID=A0AAE2CLL4_9LAMI|nr:hypothetical protein Salat_1412500 [Sesamum alatum]